MIESKSSVLLRITAAYLDFSPFSRSINVVDISVTNTKDGFPFHRNISWCPTPPHTGKSPPVTVRAFWLLPKRPSSPTDASPPPARSFRTASLARLSRSYFPVCPSPRWLTFLQLQPLPHSLAPSLCWIVPSSSHPPRSGNRSTRMSNSPLQASPSSVNACTDNRTSTTTYPPILLTPDTDCLLWRNHCSIRSKSGSMVVSLEKERWRQGTMQSDGHY